MSLSGAYLYVSALLLADMQEPRRTVIKLWLDDERKAPEGWLGVTDWRVAQRLMEMQEVTEISLDHDLGQDENGHNITVRPFVLWMLNANIIPDCIRVHSSNPDGARWVINQFRDHEIGCIRTTMTELSTLMRTT